MCYIGNIDNILVKFYRVGVGGYMYKVGLVALDGCYLSSLAGPMDAFQVANAHICNQQGEDAPQFSWQTLSPTAEPVVVSGGISLQADTTLEQAGDYDLIYLPAFPYPGAKAFDVMRDKLHNLIEWLVMQWKSGVSLASNCTGTFLLAETGLLNGREATTTWWLERQFHKRYPKVKLNSRAMITDQDGLLCAGAMTAHQNMAVHLIERYCSADIATQCAKAMLIDTSDKAQSPYQTMLSADTTGDPMVAKAQYWLQTHLQTGVDQVTLAKKMGVSQRTLIRRFKLELGVTPITYLQNVRISAAKQLLENTAMPLPEVIDQVGYSDLSSFSRLFKQRIGLTPAGYRQRFRTST